MGLTSAMAVRPDVKTSGGLNRDRYVGCHGNRTVERSTALEALDEVLGLLGRRSSELNVEINALEALGSVSGPLGADGHAGLSKGNALLLGKVLD